MHSSKSENFWGYWTIKLGSQTSDHSKSFQSLVFILTQLHFGQWSSLPFCLPSLIVQQPARVFHLWLLHMIVKVAYGKIAGAPNIHQEIVCIAL